MDEATINEFLGKIEVVVKDHDDGIAPSELFNHFEGELNKMEIQQAVQFGLDTGVLKLGEAFQVCVKNKRHNQAA